MQKWPALKKWSVEYFSARFPTSRISVHSLTFKNPGHLPGIHKTESSIKEALSLFGTDSFTKHTLKIDDVRRTAPGLLADCGKLSWLPRDRETIPTLWLTEQEQITGLHFDKMHGFLCMTFGKKRVRLFAPTESPYLQRYISERYTSKAIYQFSPIADTDNVDPLIFPFFQRLHGFEHYLMPGEILFIPAGWWHEVKSLETSGFLSYWVRPKPEECNIAHTFGTIETYRAFSAG